MRRCSGSLATTLSILLLLIFAVWARADKIGLKEQDGPARKAAPLTTEQIAAKVTPAGVCILSTR